jgi:hypothetical protein
MPLPRLRDSDVVYFLATSRDGYVADNEGSQSWAGEYFIPELGFHDFVAQVSNIMLSRVVHDQLAAMGRWPYGDIPGLVVGQGPIASGFAAPLTRGDGAPAIVVAAAKALRPGPTWIVGDTVLGANLILGGVVTRVDHYELPVWLGTGTQPFAISSFPDLVPIDNETYPNQVVRTSYSLRAT